MFWELSKRPDFNLYFWHEIFTALLSLADLGALKDEVPFFMFVALLCRGRRWLPCSLKFWSVNHLPQFTPRFMFTWAMDHAMDINALAAEPVEPKQ